MADRRNVNSEISVKRWIAVGIRILTFIGGGLIYAVTIGAIYGKAITRLDNIEVVAAGNRQDNEKLEAILNSEIRAVREYMFSLNTNIVAIGTILGVSQDKLSILKIEKEPAYKGEIN